MDESIITHKYIDPKTKKVCSREYRRLGFLGKGGFARCYRIQSKETGRQYACKIITKTKLKKKSARIKLVTEIKIHRKVSNHKHVVRFIKWFEDPKFVYIVLELCENKSLLDVLNYRGSFTESEVRYFMAQILSAMRHLHSKNVIHRDLKLGNIFVNNDYDLKLGDFGLAAMLECPSQRKMTVCGTPNYIAPEILARKSGGHSFEVDIWSLGVIMFTLMVGVPPFEAENVKSTYQRIKDNRYRFPLSSALSETSKNLIRRMLQLDPEKRPTLREIRLDSFFTESLIPKKLPENTRHEIPLITTFKHGGLSHSAIDTIDQKKILSTDCHLKNDLVNSGTEQENIKLEGVAGFKGLSESGLREKTENKISTFIDGGNSIKTHKRCRSELSGSEKTNKLPLVRDGKFAENEDGFLPNYEPPIWVKCWIDYSAKYGMGYTLSNGAHGVCFNDGSKMLLHLDESRIEYFEPLENESGEDGVAERGRGDDSVVRETRRTLDTFRYGLELRKKVTLLKYFAEYLERKNQKGDFVESPIFDEIRNPICLNSWYQTSKAKVFALSNNILQINFADQTELVISPLCPDSHSLPLVNKISSSNGTDGGCIHSDRSCQILQRDSEFYRSQCAASYTDRDGVRRSFTMSSAMSSDDSELRQRASYSYEIIRKVLSVLPRCVLVDASNE